MNSREYIDSILSANEPTSDMNRIGTTVGEFEENVRDLEETENDHIMADVEQMKADDYYESQLKDEDDPNADEMANDNYYDR